MSNSNNLGNNDDDAMDMIAMVATASGSSEDMGFMRKPRIKQSITYRHTYPFKEVKDEQGKVYSIRSCKYCDNVFSFKGGTTSAALRHLKSSHPMEYASDRAYGEDSLSGSKRSSHGVGGVESTTHESEDTQRALADSDTALGSPSNEDHVSTIESGAITKSIRKMNSKRRRYDEGVNITPPISLSPSQIAITHFMEHFKNRMSPTRRLQFVQHLMYEEKAAQMYTLLDNDTRLEYIKQFIEQDSQPTIKSDQSTQEVTTEI